MFFKDKVLTYNQKDYEDDFSENQKKDLKESSKFGIQNTDSLNNPITAKSTILNKNIPSNNENFIIGWTNKLDSFAKEKLTKLLEIDDIKNNSDLKKMIESILGIKPIIKLIICIIAFLFIIFNPGLIVFAVIIIVFSLSFYSNTIKREEIRKKIEKERQEMLENKNNQ